MQSKAVFMAYRQHLGVLLDSENAYLGYLDFFELSIQNIDINKCLFLFK